MTNSIEGHFPDRKYRPNEL